MLREIFNIVPPTFPLLCSGENKHQGIKGKCLVDQPSNPQAIFGTATSKESTLRKAWFSIRIVRIRHFCKWPTCIGSLEMACYYIRPPTYNFNYMTSKLLNFRKSSKLTFLLMLTDVLFQ